jgi:hypothetical protein
MHNVGVDCPQNEPQDVHLISVAEKLYNAHTCRTNTRRSLPRSGSVSSEARQQIGYFHELLRVFKSAGTNRIVEGFDRFADKLEKLSGGEGALDSQSIFGDGRQAPDIPINPSVPPILPLAGSSFTPCGIIASKELWPASP